MCGACCCLLCVVNRCSLFAVRCSFLVVCWFVLLLLCVSLCVVCRLMFRCRCSLSVVSCRWSCGVVVV